MKVDAKYRDLLAAVAALPGAYQGATVAALVELLGEYRDHLAKRPNPIRSAAEGYGLVAEEHHELLRQLTKTKVGESLDPIIHDFCDVSKASLSAYVDLTQVERARSTGRPGVPLARGGFDVVCTRCRRAQAWHQRSASVILCDRCAQAA
jgi:hypothetical protein